MKTLVRVACLLIVAAGTAVTAHATVTAVDPGSLAGDPTIIYKGGGDPPSCAPPYCYNLSYTAAPAIVFFNVTPPLPANPPTYNCIATGGLNCSVDINLANEFISVALYGLTNQDLELSITGGPVMLTIPSTGITCLDSDCTPGETVSLAPVPEPNSAMLWFTGLFFLACGFRRHSRLLRSLKAHSWGS